MQNPHSVDNASRFVRAVFNDDHRRFNFALQLTQIRGKYFRKTLTRMEYSHLCAVVIQYYVWGDCCALHATGLLFSIRKPYCPKKLQNLKAR